MNEYSQKSIYGVIRINTPYYLLSGAVLAAAAVLYYACDARDPEGLTRVLLAPYAKAAELFMNINLRYADGTGYSAPGLPFSIGRNCSGVNYMAAVFGMMTFMFIHKIPERRKILWIALWAPGAAAVGVVTTALRILGSIPLAGYARFSTLHAGIGISFYLGGMIICFFATEKLTQKRLNT